MGGLPCTNARVICCRAGLGYRFNHFSLCKLSSTFHFVAIGLNDGVMFRPLPKYFAPVGAAHFTPLAMMRCTFPSW